MRSFAEAVYWYESAANMAQEDECGEFDATMDFPVYELKAKVAELYMLGGFGLELDPSYAGTNCCLLSGSWSWHGYKRLKNTGCNRDNSLSLARKTWRSDCLPVSSDVSFDKFSPVCIVVCVCLSKTQPLTNS